MLEIFAEWLGIAYPWFLFVIMMLGLFALAVPIFPGNVVIWAASTVYLVIDGVDGRALLFFIPMTLLTIAAMLADNVLMGAKARQAGAAWTSIALALLAGLITSLILTPLVGLLAAPLTLFIVEFFRNKQDARLAWGITSGLMMGCGWAFFVRFGIGAVTIGLYLWWFLGGK
ncbi:MAG TPA: DUF456 domain-containing protein [Anaerolineales bacterium]|nr:DUF456 domain-containing protein [Anaerolineales bacterium]